MAKAIRAFTSLKALVGPLEHLTSLGSNTEDAELEAGTARVEYEYLHALLPATRQLSLLSRQKGSHCEDVAAPERGGRNPTERLTCTIPDSQIVPIGGMLLRLR